MYGSESEEEIQYFGFKKGEVPVTEVRESKDLTMTMILSKTVSSCSKLSELQKAFEDPDKWDENIENLRLLLPIIKRDIFDLENIVDYARGAV